MLDKDFMDFIGKNNNPYCIGVVEDNNDPLTLGRVKVRWFGIHPEDREEVPTKSLPWATVIQPAISASVSGIGWSPNGLEKESWVLGFHMDGKYAQYPVVLGSIPGVHRQQHGSSIGNSGGGYQNAGDIYEGAPGKAPWHGQGAENPVQYTGAGLPNQTGGKGAVIKDDGSYLTKSNIPNWPLEFYTHEPSYQDNGLACKDGKKSLRIHYATALALEELTRQHGRTLAITSGYRTPEYNSRLKGAARNSMHTQGRAFDITLGSIGDPIAFAQKAVKNGFVGFGLYNTFLHIDTGRGRVWNGAASRRFVSALTAAGWYKGKPGLEGVKTTPGAVADPLTGGSGNDLLTGGEDDLTKATDLSTGTGVANFSRKYLKEKYGLNDVQIAGILGTFQQESSMNPGITNSIGAYGLAQWTSVGRRKEKLFELAKSRGVPPSDVQTQLDYMMQEFNTTEKGPYSQLQSATTVDQAVGAMNAFERFRGWKLGKGGVETGSRYNHAYKYYNGWGGDPNKLKGFNDPTNSLPYGGYRGKPSTHHAARGLNANMFQPENNVDSVGNITGFPIAGDRGTFGEANLGAAPQYPHNHTYTSKSGHMMEFDDTPGAERINMRHKSGTKIEITAKGSLFERTMGRAYRMDTQDSFHGVLGDHYITSQGDLLLRTTSDGVFHADGSLTIISRNDRAEQTSGKYDLSVGEVLQIKANKILIEGASIDFYSTGGINIEAEEGLNIKAKSINEQATGGEINRKASGNIKDSGATYSNDSETSAFEQVSINDGLYATEINTGKITWGTTDSSSPTAPPGAGSSVSSVDTEAASGASGAKSTDLGSVPERSVIKKDHNPRENPDIIIGTQEAMQHYGGN